MSDSNLRDLERRFRASGSAEDEAAWLRARVQAGQLEERKLELAAYLGYGAARIATGEESDGVGASTDLQGWVLGLAGWGVEACGRVTVAAAVFDWEGHDYPVPMDEGMPMPMPTPIRVAGARARDQAALAALEAWLLCPCREHAAAAYRASEAQDVDPELTPGSTNFGCLTVYLCAQAVGEPDAFAGESWAGWCRAPRSSLGAAQLRTRIRREVIPWALGYSDPVRERVEAR